MSRREDTKIFGRFDPCALPEPQAYFESSGLTLVGRGKWRTVACGFHGGSDSMRINLVTGGWVCMACGEKGGDVLSYHMKINDMDFVEAAKALGAWVDDGWLSVRQKPKTLSPRDALEVIGFESNLVAVAAGNLANGKALDDQDRIRLLESARRINSILREYVK